MTYIIFPTYAILAKIVKINGCALSTKEKSSGLFTADSIVSIINPDNKNISTYTTEAVTKEIYTYDNIIGLNLGAEVEFINTSGWLVKKYTAEQEITNIVYGVATYKNSLDEIANKYIEGWTIDRIDKTGAAILRMGLYELKFTDTPEIVVINEAIELAKKYCDDSVRKIINAVLDKYIKE